MIERSGSLHPESSRSYLERDAWPLRFGVGRRTLSGHSTREPGRGRELQHWLVGQLRVELVEQIGPCGQLVGGAFLGQLWELPLRAF